MARARFCTLLPSCRLIVAVAILRELFPAGWE